jgi:hypothetical protein
MKLIQRRNGSNATELYRMAHWAMIAAALYWVALGPFNLQDTQPALQSTIYHVANLTLRAFVGYWIARTALGRMSHDETDPPRGIVGRAIIIAAVILTSK